MSAQKMPHVFTREGEKYYYIHRHIAHFEQGDAIASFQNQKEKGYLRMKRRYKQNYLKNIQLTDTQENILNISAQGDKFISDIDELLLEALDTNIGNSLKQVNIEPGMRQSYAGLNNFINTGEAKYLDDIFHGIELATDVLEEYLPELSILIGQQNWLSSGRNLKKLSQLIQKEIKTMENKAVSLTQEKYLALINHLNSLVIGLQQKNVNINSLRTSLTHIFSTTLGEFVTNKGIGKIGNLVEESLKKTFTGTHTISRSVKLSKDLERYRQQGDNVFKVDGSFENLKIELSNGQNLRVNLGISTKWYKGSSNGKIYKVDITNEQSFVHRAKQIASNNNERYYIYNALALVNQNSAAYVNLKASIIANTFDFLISGMGVHGDFAQFLVINGQFYSIWDIILLLNNNNYGSSNSGYTVNKNDIISISARGLTPIGVKTDEARKYTPNLDWAYKRAKETNKEIEDVQLAGYFYPQRIAKLLPKKYN